MNRFKRILSLSAVALGLACGGDELMDPSSTMTSAGSVGNSIGVGSSGETIGTDEDDYAPGQTVTITGTGWEPGETVRLHLDETPQIHEPRQWDVQADSEGNFTDTSFAPEPDDLGVTFTLTATGLSSGRNAQTVFTDANLFWHGCSNTSSWDEKNNWRTNSNPNACTNDPAPASSPVAGDVVTIRNVVSPRLSPVISSAANAQTLTILTGAQLTINAPLTLSNTLTINAGGQLTLNANLTLGNDVSVSGTWTQAAGNVAFTTTGKKITISGSGAYNQSGGTFGTLDANRPDFFLTGSTATGTQTGGTLNLNNFEVASGRTFNQSGSSLIALVKDYKVLGAFSSTGGKVHFATISGSSAVWQSTGANQFFDVEFDVAVTPNAQTISVRGDWINDVSGNLAGSNNHTVVFNGSGAQTIGGTNSTAFRNLTSNRGGGSLTLARNQTVSGALTLTQGNITTGSNVLIVNSGGSLVRTSGHVVGSLQRHIPAGAAAMVYDVGTDLAYTPLTVNVNGSGGTAGGLIGSAAGVAHASIGTSGLASSVARFWTLAAPGTGAAALGGRTYRIRLHFVDGEAGNPNDKSEIRRFNAGTWHSPIAVAPNAAPVYVRTLGSTDVNGFNAFSDFVVGVPAPAGPTADAGGPYAGTEGAPASLSGATASGGVAPLTYLWTYAAGSGVDAGATCSLQPNNAALNPSITCTDDGSYTLTLRVTDKDGNTATDNATLVLGNAHPVADAGGPYTGNEGSPVSLNGSVADAGSNDTHTWSWQYTAGDGLNGGTCSFNNAAAEDPTITCTDNGTVQLTLTARDDEGGTDDDQATLTVANVNPVANAGGPYSGSEGSGVGLTGTRTDAGSNDVLTSQWSYTRGAGVNATATCSFSPNAAALSPTINCTDNGSYQVTLTVNDDDGGTGTSNANLTVSNVEPVANAGGPYSGNEGSPVSLNGSVTDAGSNDTHTWSWQYTAGDGLNGGSCTFNNASAEDPTITCTDNGTVQLTLTVTDDDGAASAADNATLTLANVNPVANAGGPYAGDEGSAIAITGTKSDAGSNDVLTQHWTYTRGAGVHASATCSFSPNASALSTAVTCTDDGSYQLTLTVNDDDGGTGTSNANLTVANVEPVANAGGPYSGNEGAAIPLNGSVTDAGSNDTHTWAWQYTAGDGLNGGTCSFNNASAEDPTITCTDNGTVQLTLTVKDDDGAESAADGATLTVANVNPVANAGGPYSGGEGVAIALAGTKSDAGSNDVLTQQWSYTRGAGVPASATCSFTPNAAALSPTVNCTDDGSYQLTLTVSDDDGGTGISNASLTVTNADPVITAFTKSDGTPLPTTLIVAGTLNIRTTFTDQGSNDTHTAEIDCGTGYAPVGSGNVSSPFSTSCTFATIGTKTIRVKVTDDDGGYDEETHVITVKYNFDGFYAPVDRPNTMNVSKAGQAIPLKWRLTDANGAPVTDLVTLTVKAVSMSCNLGASVDQVEEYASGSSGLQNLGDGNYQFNWKTPTTYASSCKSIELVFGSGGVSYTEGPHAFFSFKR